MLELEKVFNAEICFDTWWIDNDQGGLDRDINFIRNEDITIDNIENICRFLEKELGKNNGKEYHIDAKVSLPSIKNWTYKNLRKQPAIAIKITAREKTLIPL